MTAVLDGPCVTLPALGSGSWNASVTAPAVCNQSVEKLPPYSPEAMVAFATVITFMMLFTVFGNILVIIAVQTSRLLRSPQNLFLVSLAAADILVATLIIPFSLANELMGYWYFRSVWCEIYLALDVLFCTSSIVHLCAISLDRYLSVSRALRYSGQRTPRRIKAAILVVWLISAVISFPPLLSANKSSRRAESRAGPQCQLNSERWYILYSTVGSFFVPCLIMILVYLRIYQIAKRHTRCPPGAALPPPLDAPVPSQQNSERAPNAYKISDRRAPLSPDTILPASSLAPPRTPTVPPPSPVLPLPKGPCHFWSGPNRKQSKLGDTMADSCRCCSSSGSDGEGEERDPPSGRGRAPNTPGPADELRRALPPGGGLLRNTIITTAGGTALVEAVPSPARRRAAMNREKRFTFVLAVVIGVFVLCWFPFFFSYSLKAICPEVCALPEPLFKFFFWIGYCNSSLNPLIYTIFNNDFRRAFKKILCHSTRDTVF